MSNERNESVSTQGRILFACGTVLGVCLGFAAGHLSVWSRFSSSAEQDPSVAHWESQDWPTAPPLGTERLASANPLDQQLNAGRPQPFFAPSARRLTTSHPVNVTRPDEPTRMASGVLEPASDPPGLAHTQPAAPPDDATRYREHLTRSIISDELPHASPQEVEVWFDVLRDLDPSDVKGILRMRKHVGGPGQIVAGAPGILPNPVAMPQQQLSEEEHAIPSLWLQSIDSLLRVRAVRLHNLCNTQTAGYQRLAPVMSDVGHNDRHCGVRLVRIEHAMAPGEFHHTGRPLDIAIEGPGFLRVRSGDKIRFTRRGRLSINDDRQMVLADPSQDWSLDPPLVVPDDAESLTVDAAGLVLVTTAGNTDPLEVGKIVLHKVLDPSSMRYMGEGLYETTPHSGPASPINDGSHLRQFGVERLPQSVIEAERALLEQEEQLIDCLRRSAGTASINDAE